MIDWVTITDERKMWVDKNFPPDVYEHSLLGMIEEMGEFTHHYLKDLQGIRGSHEEHLELMRDSIGDIAIYLLGVMFHKTIYPQADYATMWPHLKEDSTESLIFKLNYQIALMPDIALISKVNFLCKLMHELSSRFGWDFEEIVTETWDHVKQRDWTKNKQDGSVEEAMKVQPRSFGDTFSPGHDL